MAVKTYGEILHEGGKYLLKVEPHVAITLKNLFPVIPRTATGFLEIPEKDGVATELIWFMLRYPLKKSEEVEAHLIKNDTMSRELIAERDRILLPDYVPQAIKMRKTLRNYQLQWIDFIRVKKRGLNADWAGLGKTAQLIGLAATGALPMAIFVKKHLRDQWVAAILEFSDLRPHVIKTRKTYNLPTADIYIFTYGKASGWSDVFGSGFFKAVGFDEIHELRIADTLKYKAAQAASKNAEYAVGLSATPIYNYAIEVFNILNLLEPGCAGERSDFVREWFTSGKFVDEPEALGAYLREKHLVIRRTKEDVGMELPPVNTIHETIETDEKAYADHTAMAKQLANKVLHGRFDEAGQAARELNIMVRQATGIAKAKGVAEYVKILLDAGEQVLLFGWHLKVYEIWMEELAQYNPVQYRGTDTERNNAKAKFMSGEAKVMIISLASGEGLDGLQYGKCVTIVFGELDWSNEKHNQCIWRLDRPGQNKLVTVIYLTCQEGSDPPMIELLGIKAAQSRSIIDPGQGPQQVHSDSSRIKMLARSVLAKKGALEIGYDDE